jgi:hypothetical protein
MTSYRQNDRDVVGRGATVASPGYSGVEEAIGGTMVEPSGQPSTAQPSTGQSAEPSTIDKAKGAASNAASDVSQTVKHEAGNVATTVADQAHRVAQDTRHKVVARADSQRQQWSRQLGDMSKELRDMAGAEPSSPARRVVAQLADRGSMLADYLTQHRAEDLLTEVQGFARRRPGTFLVGLAAAGFVVGRLGRSLAMAKGNGSGSSQTFARDGGRQLSAGTTPFSGLAEADPIGAGPTRRTGGDGG